MYLHADAGKQGLALAEMVAERQPLVVFLVVLREIFGRLPKIIGEGKMPDEVAVAQLAGDVGRKAEGVAWPEIVERVVAFVDDLVFARKHEIEAAAEAETRVEGPRIAYFKSVAQAIAPQQSVRLAETDAVEEINQVVFHEGAGVVAVLLEVAFGIVAQAALAAQHVDALVGHLDGTVGGMGKNHSGEEVELVVEPEDGAEVEVEVHGDGRTHQTVVALGPVGHADAPSVVELELGPVDEVAVAEAEHRVAVAQVDGLLAFLVEVVLHRVVFEAEGHADVWVVEETLPVFRAVGLVANADVGAKHGVVGIDGEGDMVGIAQGRLHEEALGRKPQGRKKENHYDPAFSHGSRAGQRSSFIFSIIRRSFLVGRPAPRSRHSAL